MKKLRKTISALTLSASLLLTGCAGGASDPSAPGGAVGQNSAQAAQNTTRGNGYVQAEIGQNETYGNDTGGASQSSAAAMTMDLNGYSVTVSDAIYCSTENGDMAMIAGEYSGVYVLLILSSSTSFQANTSLSQKDFGNTKEIGAALVEPASGLVISDNSQVGVTGASFSIKDISDSGMNVSISATLNESGFTYTISASGTVTLSDLDTCTRLFNDINDLAVTVESSSSSGGGGGGGGGQPFTCTGCKGSKKCQYCYGKGSGVCGACLGQLDHCMSCGGTHECKYCRGSGICHHCNGEGVMY